LKGVFAAVRRDECSSCQTSFYKVSYVALKRRQLTRWKWNSRESIISRFAFGSPPLFGSQSGQFHFGDGTRGIHFDSSPAKRVNRMSPFVRDKY
jgi:hypothetical protein